MRKLAAGAAGFSAAILISHYFLAGSLPLVIAAVCSAAAFAGLLLRGNNRLRVFIILWSLAAGFLWSFTYNALFVLPYWQLHEQERVIEAVITGYPVARDPRGYRADAEYKLPGRPAAGIRLYYYNEQDLEPGDRIRVKAKLWRTDISSSGERYDTLTSRGIFLSAGISEEIRVISSDDGPKYIPVKIAAAVAAKTDEIYPPGTAAFLKALLTGIRDDLNSDAALQASLSGSGIIHIVAVSGMHVSFLMGFLSLILQNRRLFAFYAIPALVFFMAITGFTPSVTRAGIMQIILICAPLFRRESDSVTSLSTALVVLLAANPYACASAGLQLSFAAASGIILFTARINNAVSDYVRGKRINKNKAGRAAVRYISSGLSATAGAMVFTIPLSAARFGYVSLIAPLTNLLVMGAVSVTFPLGIISVILGFIHPYPAAAAAFPVKLTAGYITAVARLFASVPFAVTYSSNAHIMFWLGYVYIIFTVLPLLKARLRQYIYPACISIILLFSVILASLLIPALPPGSISVIDVGQGLSVAALTESYTMLIDCGSSSTNRAGEITHEYLSNLGCTSVDMLVLTHFHDDHINGVELLLSRMNINTLAVPDPDGSYAAQDIIELARRRGTDIMYITETIRIAAGQSVIYLYPPLGSGDENERGISVLIMGRINALVTGDMNSAVERALLRYADLPGLDLLVAGHHGSRDSACRELLDALSPGIAVIPVGKNSFGHPHPETLERLELAGAAVYRTDESGHVMVFGK